MFQPDQYKFWQPDFKNEVKLSFLKNLFTNSVWFELNGLFEVGRLPLTQQTPKLIILVSSIENLPFIYMSSQTMFGMYPLTHSPEWNDKIIYQLSPSGLVEKMEVRKHA